jgi:hypothetical protein
MKTISTLFILLALLTANGFAQTTYTVSSNSNYSAACTNCTFNIASGVTLTISASGTCADCTFNGGNIIVAQNITCQPCAFSDNTITMSNQSIKPNSGTTSFSNVNMTVSGTGFILANTPVTITGSTFTFKNTSYFNNNGGQLDISSSTLYFYDNAYFNANAGPVNLKNSSSIIAGNGSSSSAAFIKINGPALNVYDNSSAVILGNTNNYYYNWSPYSSISNSKTFTTTYPSAASTMNCGGAGQNACGMWSAPTVYGPATFNYAGVVSITDLPVILTDFVVNASAGNASITWTTQQEVNSSYFSIERSANGSNWEQIATVDAKGNSAIKSNYGYNDNAPLNGVGYYRLKMVDLDGSYMYSDIKVIHATLVKGISFFPNPTKDYVNVSLSGSASEVTVQLISQSGQVLQERKAAAGNAGTVSMNVQQYAQGMYILKVTGAGVEQTGKLMIAH